MFQYLCRDQNVESSWLHIWFLISIIMVMKNLGVYLLIFLSLLICWCCVLMHVKLFIAIMRLILVITKLFICCALGFHKLLS